MKLKWRISLLLTFSLLACLTLVVRFIRGSVLNMPEIQLLQFTRDSYEAMSWQGFGPEKGKESSSVFIFANANNITYSLI